MAGYSKPSELLNDLDAHGIYNAQMLGECSFDTSTVPTQSVEDIRQEIAERGLGGSVYGGPDDRLIVGWKVATALAYKFLSGAPGNRYQGRGSSFRANLKALEEAGQ